MKQTGLKEEQTESLRKDLSTGVLQLRCDQLHIIMNLLLQLRCDQLHIIMNLLSQLVEMMLVGRHAFTPCSSSMFELEGCTNNSMEVMSFDLELDGVFLQ